MKTVHDVAVLNQGGYVSQSKAGSQGRPVSTRYFL